MNKTQTSRSSVRVSQDSNVSEEARILKDIEKAAIRAQGKKQKFTQKSNTKKKKNLVFPHLLITDTHFGAVVDESQVRMLNKYDTNIGINRFNRVIDTALNLCEIYGNTCKYGGFVLAFGGDIFEGEATDYFREGNDTPIMDLIFKISDKVIVAIRKLADTFGDVYVPCVTGNHGRLREKYRPGSSVKENYDYAFYRMLALVFQDDPRVIIDISESGDLDYEVCGVKYLLTHGDSMVGSKSPDTLSTIVKIANRKKQLGIEAGFIPDKILMGHFHQSVDLPNVRVGGSLIGYTAYALSMCLPYEPAKQSFWFNELGFGETLKMDIFGEDPTKSLSEVDEECIKIGRRSKAAQSILQKLRVA